MSLDFRYSFASLRICAHKLCVMWTIMKRVFLSLMCSGRHSRLRNRSPISNYRGDPLFRPYPNVKGGQRPIPGFHRVRPQTSKYLSPPRRSEGNYTSLRSIQASAGTKSTSAKSRIHQDPDCAELCAGPALATSRFSPSPTEGARSRDGTASGSDVGNSGNQITGRNPGKRPGFTDLGPEKWPNPTQSEMWRTVSLRIPRIPVVPILIRPKRRIFRAVPC
jgi:hypothetical protein